MSYSSIIKSKNGKEFLISELEKTYSGFKSFNPDADEHWLLINTYLARYGNYEDQKQKGPGLMKYIAYKDTFQFSFLKAPDSIRALGFYLVYKVLGEEEYEPYAEEFNKLYEKIQTIFEKRNLLEEYKRINPFTYNELKSEKDNTEWSLMGLLESSDYLNKNPDAQDFASKIMGDL